MGVRAGSWESAPTFFVFVSWYAIYLFYCMMYKTITFFKVF